MYSPADDPTVGEILDRIPVAIFVVHRWSAPSCCICFISRSSSASRHFFSTCAATACPFLLRAGRPPIHLTRRPPPICPLSPPEGSRPRHYGVRRSRQDSPARRRPPETEERVKELPPPSEYGGPASMALGWSQIEGKPRHRRQRRRSDDRAPQPHAFIVVTGQWGGSFGRRQGCEGSAGGWRRRQPGQGMVPDSPILFPLLTHHLQTIPHLSGTVTGQLVTALAALRRLPKIKKK